MYRHAPDTPPRFADTPKYFASVFTCLSVSLRSSHKIIRPSVRWTPRILERSTALVVWLEKDLQRFACARFAFWNLRLLPILNQPAKKIKIIQLICRKRVTSYNITDFRHISKIRLVVDRTRREHSAQPSIVFWQRGKTSFGRSHRISFHPSDLPSRGRRSGESRTSAPRANE